MATYTSRLVIEILNDETGERAQPGNLVIDACYGLTAEQAKEHHTMLKSAIAQGWLLAVESGEVQKFAQASGL